MNYPGFRLTPLAEEGMREVNRRYGLALARSLDYLTGIGPRPVSSAAELSRRLAHDPTPWGAARLPKEFTE